jgi:hypothetical protein
LLSGCFELARFRRVRRGTKTKCTKASWSLASAVALEGYVEGFGSPD